ncbi:MAG TPA: portal protein [Phycisphaerae bacterium]|nr:portal protein [Phycisphaerae bacterium]
MATKKANATELLLLYKQARDERSTWESMWQELVDYYVPNKTSVVTKRQPGTKRTEKLFDATALDAVQRLTASMHGNLTPPPTKWFYLKMRLTELNEDHEVTEWLEECASRMRQAFNQSNLSSEINELYADLIVFGTGFMLEEQKKKTIAGKFGGLRFKTYATGTYCIEEDSDGLVDTVWREFKFSARQAYQKWGEDAKKSLKIRQCLEPGGKPHTRFTFLHAIYPRESYSTKPDRSAMEFPIASCYVCLEDRKLIFEGGYEEFPGMAPRWSKSSDEIYGRGPGLTALPDVKTLNRAKELGLKAWAKEIDPPLLVKDAGVIGNVRTTPGGQTVITEIGAVTPLDLRIRQDVTRYNIEMLVQAIRAMLYADQLILKESPQMTAEEVRARMELMQRILGPTLGRLETELLNRMIERTFSIMLREGALPEPPPQVLEAYQNNEADIDIEYEGPLSKAQRNIEAEAIERSIALRMEMLKAGLTDAFDTLNIRKATRLIDKIRGVPDSVMNSEDEVEAMVQARIDAQDAMQKQQDAAVSAQTAKTTAEAAGNMSKLPPEMMNEESGAMQ